MPLTKLTKKLLEANDEEFVSELEYLLKLPASAIEISLIRRRIAEIQGGGYERAMQVFNRLNERG